MNEGDEGRERRSDSNCIDSNSDCTSNNKNRKLLADAEIKNQIQIDLSRFKQMQTDVNRFEWMKSVRTYHWNHPPQCLAPPLGTPSM